MLPPRRDEEEPEEDLDPTGMRKRGNSRGGIPLHEGKGLGSDLLASGGKSPCPAKNKIYTEPLAKVTCSVIPAKAGIQNSLKILDSGSRFACPG